jgi:hypothetical protein
VCGPTCGWVWEVPYLGLGMWGLGSGLDAWSDSLAFQDVGRVVGMTVSAACVGCLSLLAGGMANTQAVAPASTVWEGRLAGRDVRHSTLRRNRGFMWLACVQCCKAERGVGRPAMVLWHRPQLWIVGSEGPEAVWWAGPSAPNWRWAGDWGVWTQQGAVGQ